MAGTIASMKKSGSILGPVAIIAGVGAIAYIAYKAFGGGASESNVGQFSLGGQDVPEDKAAYGAYLPAAQDPESPFQRDRSLLPQQAAEVDALGASEFGTGSNSEGLLDPHDNPFPQTQGQYDARTIAHLTAYPTPQESAQADFLSAHPVAGWSLVGASLIPSWFSTQGAKYGAKFAEDIAPNRAAVKGISSATEEAAAKSLDKRAVSFLDRQILKGAEKSVSEDAAQAGVKVLSKKTLLTGAKYGVKSVPFIGLGAGIAIDKASGVGTYQAITRNVVGDIFGGVAGAAGALAGGVGGFAGAVGGQIGGEQATDFLWKTGQKAAHPFTLSTEEKLGLAGADPKLDVDTGRFAFDKDYAIMREAFRPSAQAASVNQMSAASMLQQANAWRAAQAATASAAQAASLSPGGGQAGAIAAVRDTYAAQIQQASASGRAAMTTSPSGQQVVAGPTGNVYVQVSGNKYAYAPGPSTPVLGASFISSSKSSAPTAGQQAIKASINKALTGPKVSAKGKYTPAKSTKKK